MRTNNDQTERILEIIESLDIVSWYDKLDKEDYQVIKDAIVSCKDLINNVEGNESLVNDFMGSIDDLEAIFFELSKDPRFKEVGVEELSAI